MPISIHAPHEGERRENGIYRDMTAEISIHAPHEGERLAPALTMREKLEFQSTLPTRGSDQIR